MHFQREDPNTAVTRPVDRLWQLWAQKTCLGSGCMHKVAKCCKHQFWSLKQKRGIMHFQWEYAWLRVWHIISHQPCKTEWWFQDHCESNDRVTDDVTWPQKNEVMTPIYLKLDISRTVPDRRLVQNDHTEKTTNQNPIVTWLMMSLVAMVTA